MADIEEIETPFLANEGGEENVLLLSDDKVKEGQLRSKQKDVIVIILKFLAAVHKKHLSRSERIEKWRNFVGFWLVFCTSC